MKDIKMQLPKVTLDDLFTTQEERDNKNKEKIIEIPIKEISDFPILIKKEVLVQVLE